MHLLHQLTHVSNMHGRSWIKNVQARTGLELPNPIRVDALLRTPFQPAVFGPPLFRMFHHQDPNPLSHRSLSIPFWRRVFIRCSTHPEKSSRPSNRTLKSPDASAEWTGLGDWEKELKGESHGKGMKWNLPLCITKKYKMCSFKGPTLHFHDSLT